MTHVYQHHVMHGVPHIIAGHVPVAVHPAAQAALAPQGVFGDILGAVAPTIGSVVGGLGGLLPFSAQPQYVAPQAVLAPQGVLGNILGGLLPFSAQPQAVAPQAALAPQGVFGDILGAVAPTIGSVVGGLGGLLPFSAQPQYVAPQAVLAPQGVFGNIVSSLAPTVGQAVGGLLGNAGAGQQIGSVAGQIANLLPFSAQPQYVAPQAVLAPQGVLGNILGGLLPFSAQPQAVAPQAVLAPQGVFGNIVSSLAPTVGQAVGGLLGNAGAGQQIGSVAGHIANLLPFSAQPQYVAPQAVLAPQGAFGDFVRAVAPSVGQAVGGALGNAAIGQQIGNVAGHFAGFLPLSVQPVSTALH